MVLELLGGFAIRDLGFGFLLLGIAQQIVIRNLFDHGKIHIVLCIFKNIISLLEFLLSNFLIPNCISDPSRNCGGPILKLNKVISDPFKNLFVLFQNLALNA